MYHPDEPDSSGIRIPLIGASCSVQIAIPRRSSCSGACGVTPSRSQTSACAGRIRRFFGIGVITSTITGPRRSTCKQKKPRGPRLRVHRIVITREILRMDYSLCDNSNSANASPITGPTMHPSTIPIRSLPNNMPIGVPITMIAIATITPA